MDGVFISGEKIYLRPLEVETDLELLYKGENDPQVRDALFLALPASRENLRNRLQEWTKSKEIIAFTIIEPRTESPIGMTAFFRVDYIHRAAVFYLALLNSTYWGKGFGSEVTYLMVEYAFNTLNLNRIQLHVCAENSAAIKIYQKVGFNREGILRQAMYRQGAFVDFWVMGFLKSEYNEKHRTKVKGVT